MQKIYKSKQIDAFQFSRQDKQMIRTNLACKTSNIRVVLKKDEPELDGVDSYTLIGVHFFTENKLIDWLVDFVLESLYYKKGWVRRNWKEHIDLYSFVCIKNHLSSNPYLSLKTSP